MLTSQTRVIKVKDTDLIIPGSLNNTNKLKVIIRRFAL